MNDTGALVYVVDDDASAREGVARLIRSAGLMTKTFASGEEFLATAATQHAKLSGPGCESPRAKRTRPATGACQISVLRSRSYSSPATGTSP